MLIEKSDINKIRWFTRILGGLLFLFVLVEIIEYFSASGLVISKKENLLWNLFGLIPIISMMLGIVIAWFREAIGSIMILGVFIYYLIGMLIISKVYWSRIDVIFPIIALLHLFCWWQSRK